MRAHDRGPALVWRRAARAAGVFAFVLMARSSHAAPVVHHVHIESQRFVPDSLVVQAGDRIVWDNRDLVPHTATALTKEWDTGLIKPGAQASVTLGRAGRVRYHCLYHLHMVATVQVRAGRSH